ncbi:hypothetical protein LSH36_582g00014 [Paralvinella palmiformis]|uniref:Uncharacterized protein n=1 Tax=Paralvinella palmiformis TaxID=53620 RepID=A0AAD9MWY1_9ANNE|nr:hypothetical protein LSH36_582g00014 [Paralvinella palmiformis]
MSFPKWLPRIVTTDRATMAFISAWNIGIIVAFPYLGWSLSLSTFNEFMFAFPTPELLASRDALFRRIALVNGLSTFLAFFIGSVTCRIHVRGIFWSLPVLLSTSLTVCLILVHFGYGLVPNFAGYGWRYSGDIIDAVLPIPDRTLELVCYGLVWIAIPSVVSHLWLVRDHVTTNGDT